MTLTVAPQALVGYATQIDQAADDVVEIRSYLHRYAEVGTGGGLPKIARGGHDRAVNVIDSTLSRLMCLLQASAPELQAAAGPYRSIDATPTVE